MLNINTMKRQKDMTPEDELPRLVDVQYATREEQRNSSIKKGLRQSGNCAEMWMGLVLKVKSSAVKNNIA